MKKRAIKGIILYLLLNNLAFTTILAQKSTKANKEKTERISTQKVKENFDLQSKITKRNFDPKAIENYKQNSDFQYQDSQEYKYNFLERFLEWLSQKLFLGYTSPAGRMVLKIIYYTLIGFTFIYLVWVFFKLQINDMFGKTSLSNHLDFKELLENIHSVNFEKLIEDAEKLKKYNEVIRLHYLHILEKLSDLKRINWQIDKTNLDYLKEMKSNELYKDFHLLTNQFEYIHYGDFRLKEDDFENTQSSFLKFKKMI